MYTWTCGFCGAEFKTPYYLQRYCDRSCQNKAYYERKRNRKTV